METNAGFHARDDLESISQLVFMSAMETSISFDAGVTLGWKPMLGSMRGMT